MSESDTAALALVENMETSGDTSPEKRSKHSRSKDKSKKAVGKNVEVQNGNGNAKDENMEDGASIPQPILRRVNALRKLQLDTVNIEAEFHQKLHELEVEFSERLALFNDKRQKIVTGSHEPTDEECKITLEFDQEFLADELEKQAAIEKDLPESEKNKNGKGIKEFWLTVLRNDMAIGSLIESHDEPILRHLTDIQLKVEKEPMKFTLSFHFSPNEFFTNDVLTKDYILKCEPDEYTPFEFSGSEICVSDGCHIDWKVGKNVTVKMVTKKLKHKHKGEKRIVKREEKAESFFNFFSPPEVPDDLEEVDEDLAQELEFDFEVGQLFRDRVIPKAVLIYTDELPVEDEMDEDEDEMEFGEDDDDEDDD